MALLKVAGIVVTCKIVVFCTVHVPAVFISLSQCVMLALQNFISWVYLARCPSKEQGFTEITWCFYGEWTFFLNMHLIAFSAVSNAFTDISFLCTLTIPLSKIDVLLQRSLQLSLYGLNALEKNKFQDFSLTWSRFYFTKNIFAQTLYLNFRVTALWDHFSIVWFLN